MSAAPRPAASEGASADVPPRSAAGQRLDLLRLFVHLIDLARRTFRNWPAVLATTLRQTVGMASAPGAEMRMDTRSGLRIACPATPLAQAPVWEVFATDDYGLARLDDRGRAGPLLAVDVGAHIGCFALAVAARSPAWHVACFEPSPSSAEYLRRNVSGNGMADRVHVVEAAVAARSGVVTLWENGPADCSNTTVSGLWRAPAGSPGAVKALERATSRAVPALALEHALREARAAAGARPDAAIDVLKIDCEGAEHEIVLESPDSAWAGVRLVLLEYHPVPGGSRGALDERLASLGLRLWWDQPSRLGLAGVGIAAYRRQVSA